MRSAQRRRVRVVRDHHGRLAELVDRVAQEAEHVVARRRVEVAGRLVREQHARARDERARDRDPLLLAARELRRPVPAAIGDPDRLEQLLEPLALGLAARDRQRQEHVLLRRQHRQQVEELEDEADLRSRRSSVSCDVVHAS